MQTTLQTIYNITNLMLGVSILTLPSVFNKCGWVMSLCMMVVVWYVSNVCGRLLVSCQYAHQKQGKKPLITYGDVAEAAFGLKGRIFIQTVFSLELFAACVALLLLVAHSVMLIFDIADNRTTITIAVCWSVMTLTTLPRSLSLLSYASFLGLLCIINLMVVILVDGFNKKHYPGSLLDIAPTQAWPTDWIKIPSCFGIFVAGVSAAACYAGFYTSMEKPYRFSFSIKVSYLIAFIVNVIVGATGYLMFGSQSASLITENLGNTAYGYSKSLYIVMMVLVAMNPCTKYPLNLYPIILELERYIFDKKIEVTDVVDDVASDDSPLLAEIVVQPTYVQVIKRSLLRILISSFVLVCAILFPHFDRILGILGSLFSTTSSILFPICCWLAISSHSKDDMFNSQATLLQSYYTMPDQDDHLDSVMSVGKYRRATAAFTLIVFFVGAVVGTIFAVCPDSLFKK